MRGGYLWDEKHRLIVRGFYTKAELKENIGLLVTGFLETLTGMVPEDGVYEALTYSGGRLVVSIHNRRITRIR